MAPKEEQVMESGSEKGKGKMKLIIIIAAAVIVVAGGIGGYFFFSSKGPSKEAAPKVDVKGVPIIYSLEPFIVNIYDGQDLRYLRVKVEMDVASEEVKAEMDARKAQFRDAILVLLSTKTLLDVRDEQGKNQLRQEIFTAVNNILSPGKLKRIYFTDFVVQ
ncbi:MAG TPA: flagellar basal body-associated FliL family protein [Geobacteraceae bacterium]|nr:flagellar basal body-associated FliL family protein [Geobacteraceae bacterium]